MTVNFPNTNLSEMPDDHDRSLSIRALDLAIPKAKATLNLNISYNKEAVEKTLESTLLKPASIFIFPSRPWAD